MGIASDIEADRVAYAELLASSRTRSIFAEAWWLDAVTGSPDGWQPNLLRAADGTARAAWPLPTRSVATGLVGTGAAYTPWLGPILPAAPQGGREITRISRDVELLQALAQQLDETYAHVEAACMPELDYWTPLAWHGFEQTTRTTWRLPADTTGDDIRAGMRKGARSTLSAAERDGLSVVPGTVEELIEACAATFAHQHVSEVPAAQVLERVAQQAIERERGEIWAVRLPHGELASAGLFVFDDRCTYSLANGRIPIDGTTGAPTLLLWHAIGTALDRSHGFDFEGSMLQPVEHFVRGFGGTPHQYSVVRRSSPAWQRTVARKRRLKRLLGR